MHSDFVAKAFNRSSIAADHGATDGIAVTATVLGQRVHDKICTELQGLRSDWRCKGRVDDQSCRRRARDRGEKGDIDEFQDGIAWSFSEEDSRPVTRCNLHTISERHV